MSRSASEQKRVLLDAFVDQPELAGTLELVLRQAQASLPAERLPAWLDLCRELSARIGSNAGLAYVRNSPAVAGAAGSEAAFALAAATSEVARLASPRGALALLVAAPAAARQLALVTRFAEWLRIVQLVAAIAPESVALLLERSERVLASLDLRGFEAWALRGVRATESDPEHRLKYFALLDKRALDALEQSVEGVQFADIERALKAYVTALWGRAPALRTLPPAGLEAPQRPTFDSGIIRVPQTFRGFAGRSARDIFHAALAHILAHLQFTRTKFPVGSLKPVQVALVSLIEDARVEQLALSQLPGLARLWRPFHTATSAHAITAPALMARLSRALIDPDYDDPHGWVRKGRELFFADPAAWQDSAISRSIGSLLGNDLGQMRAQFNAKTYVVEPPYRDDNQGLWELPPAGAPADVDAIYESVRFEEGEAESADRSSPEGAEGEANRAKLRPADAEVGIPVARYPEWDFLIGAERRDWATLVEYDPAEGKATRIEAALERYPEVVYRITALIRAAKVSRPQRLRWQSEGDRLDLEASIAAAIDRRLGLTPNPKVYARLERRYRDLSVLVLMDASQSTNDIVPGLGRPVIEVERDATALLAHAMDRLGDPFAVHAFCSETRENVHYYRIKDFGLPWNTAAKRRLAALTGRLSTRMGTALRHAGQDLAQQMTYRRLVLLVSDGEPSDVDVADRRYLVEDARHAVLQLQHQGIDVFCVGLDPRGDDYLTRIFGRRNVVQLDRIERLPEKLPLLYFRLVA